jgi:hypothetical protein
MSGSAKQEARLTHVPPMLHRRLWQMLLRTLLPQELLPPPLPPCFPLPLDYLRCFDFLPRLSLGESNVSDKRSPPKSASEKRVKDETPPSTVAITTFR